MTRTSSCKESQDFSSSTTITSQGLTSRTTTYSEIDFQQIFEYCKKAQSEDQDHQFVSERSLAEIDGCPIHSTQKGPPQTPQNPQNEPESNWSKKSRMAVRICNIVSYVACPPILKTMFRKIVFSPPPKLLHYYFVSTGDDGTRIPHTTALSAHTANRPLTFCLPYATSPHLQLADVLLQLRRIEVETTMTSCDNCLALVHVTCEKTSRLRPSFGIQRSPQLVIFAQPNSTDLGMCMFTDPNLADISDFLQCDLLAFDYSGYGISTGTSKESSVYADMDAVWKYAREVLGYEEHDIILLGFSIGTAAVSYLASTHLQVRGMILFAPFTSFLRVLLRHPRQESTCKHDQFCTLERADKIQCKTFICHGERDGVVRSDHSVVLSKKIPNCEAPILVDATHQSIFCDRSTWDLVRFFVLQRCGIHNEWDIAKKMALSKIGDTATSLSSFIA